MPDDQVIRQGQQIGVMIFSSDREFTLWPTPGTELTVDLNATSITLPIVGGIEAYEAAVKNNMYLEVK
jgi:X-Pro dipeptidyl-peptidase